MKQLQQHCSTKPRCRSFVASCGAVSVKGLHCHASWVCNMEQEWLCPMLYLSKKIGNSKQLESCLLRLRNQSDHNPLHIPLMITPLLTREASLGSKAKGMRACPGEKGLEKTLSRVAIWVIGQANEPYFVSGDCPTKIWIYLPLINE